MPNNSRKPLTRALRRDMTDAEKCLWSLLRDRRLAGEKFRRQAPIGPYIADFYCHQKRLVVEADGGQHLDSQADLRRTCFLNDRGITVLRFWNSEILNESESVLERILEALSDRAPSPAPSGRPPLYSRGPRLPEGEASVLGAATARTRNAR